MRTKYFSATRLIALRAVLVVYAAYAIVDCYVMGWQTSYFLSHTVRVVVPLLAVGALLLARWAGRRVSLDVVGLVAAAGIGWQFLMAFGGFTPWIGLLLCVAVVALCRPRIPRLGRGARRHLLLLHVATSVGWLGIALTMVLLSVVGLTGEAELSRSAYELMHIMDLGLVIPMVLTSVISGVALSVATTWGLFRHWWVLIKFVISMVILLTAAFYENFLVRKLAGVDFDRVEDMGARVELVACMIIFSALLVIAAALSVYKPRRLTPWQRRRESSAAAAAPFSEPAVTGAVQ